MTACDLCFRETRNRSRNDRGELLCADCREAAAQVDSQTPEERRADALAIAAYFEEVQ